jgi:hypothetical protein
MTEVHDLAARVQDVLLLECDQPELLPRIGRTFDAGHEVGARARIVQLGIDPEAHDEQRGRQHAGVCEESAPGTRDRAHDHRRDRDQRQRPERIDVV